MINVDLLPFVKTTGIAVPSAVSRHVASMIYILATNARIARTKFVPTASADATCGSVEYVGDVLAMLTAFEISCFRVNTIGLVAWIVMSSNQIILPMVNSESSAIYR